MKSWLKKIPFIITLLAVLTGGVLLPFSKVKADEFQKYRDLFEPNSSITFINSTSSSQGDSPSFRIKLDTNETAKDKVEDVYNLVYGQFYAVNSNTLVIALHENGNTSAPYIINDIHTAGQLVNYPASADFSWTWQGFIDPKKTYMAELFFRADIDGENGGDASLGTDGKDFYRIGAPIIFKTSTGGQLDASGDVTTIQQTGSQTQGTTEPRKLPICIGETSITHPLPDIDIAGCLAQGVYWALFVPTSFIFSLTGQLLDWSMAYTTDSNSYSGSSAGFVEKGWKITRDIANIFFIFVLLYTAIGTILGLHSVNAKKTVGMVILIALLLNFSLLFTKIIVDASNILGNVFYNNIGTTDTSNVSNPWIQENIKNVSVAIVSKFNPQTIFQDAGALKLNTPSGIESPGGIDGAPAPGQFAIVSILMAIINLVGIWVFLTVAFLFLGRVIGLWIAMIFAPIAFVSYILPDGAGKILGEMHHSKWWDSLLKQAFVVPIFLFFMYLVLTFMSTNFFKDAFGAKTTTQTILGVVVPLLLIAMLLTKARKIAVDMSGEIGGGMTKLASFAGGAAVGLASGSLAFAGRNTIGKYYMGIANNDKLKKAAAAGDKTAQRRLATANSMAKNSFDFRNTGAAKLVAKQSGYDFNNVAVTGLGLGTDKFKGGRKAQFDHEVEHEEEKMKSYMLSGAAAKTQDDINNKYKIDLKEAEKNHKEDYDTKLAEALALAKSSSVDPAWQAKYESDRDAMKVEYASRGGTFDEAEFKKKYEKGESITEYGKTIKGVTPPVITFDEAAFKKKYMAGEEITAGKEKIKGEKKAEFDETAFKNAYSKAGGDLSKYKITEKNAKGESLRDADGKLIYKEKGKDFANGVDSSKDVNDNRRAAYANSLNAKHHKEEVSDLKSALRMFSKNILTGMGKISSSGIGKTSLVGGTIAGGVVGTGIVGAGILGGGILYAIRETIMPNIHATDPEVVAAIRKGPDEKKEFLKKLKKEMKEGDDHDDHKEEAHAPAAAHPPEPAHPPAGGGAPHHH